MVIYELIGITAAIDWGDRSERRDLGLFTSMEGADRRADEWKSDKEWRMIWDRFEIVERTVNED